MNKYIIKINVLLRYNSHLVPEPQPHGKGGRCRGRPDKEYLHILSLLVATGSKESPTANPKPNDKSAGNEPKQQTGNFGIGDSTRENPTVASDTAGTLSGGRIYFGRPKSTPCWSL